ncbi:ATP-dependent DNA helicase [Georgfuchsia toluolica]|uniref:ATP-dependent DNA helicase RecG n=1 Tax=Georgfuchsia toluolica TaxID=424218 RepID=A0A916N9R0_9PROT|nr:ATP-dependent DNA helicase RecG [Georgfuchsia toluolica]CAG4884305.1 ATP-dependent DNA helicase [Georgfuchsia toluolica]
MSNPPQLSGVGPTLAAKLVKLGLHRDADLLLHLPLRYEDETRITPVRDAVPGEAAQFELEVVSTEIAYRPRRQLLCHVHDDSGTLLLRFLNFYPSQQKALQPGACLRAFGEVRGGFFGTEMIHPRFHVLHGEEPLPQALTPIYPTVAGVGQATLRKLIGNALQRVALDDTLPDELRGGLSGFAESIHQLHQPPGAASEMELTCALQPYWQRIRFDELLAQQLSLRRAYAARRTRGAPRLTAINSLTGKLLAALPFKLTRAQQKAWREIAADLAQPYPMQRLLQGDVGSGKTIVAALAMLQAAENGYQAALMAPTEILAEQHYRKLRCWLDPLGIPLAWLSGSLKRKQKNEMATAIASGEARLVVGTHALIEEDVAFAKLGLTIVDEQHRFGVRQRLALKQKAASPHQLTMSATPIPRTLAMSYYADLDVSLLDELPPGRTPVKTKLVTEGKRDQVIARVRDACAQGRQAYWVCPLVEESETLQLKTAEETFAHLTIDMPDLRIGLVHGRLRGEEKAAAMEAFTRGEIQVLVATTVIEVGVDVVNASLMVIEHAERFGLAQLHQLRGRVGRGITDSVCILLYASPLSQTARQRLKVIFETNDGFEIARQDLALRGPGEFIGARQSGMPLLRYADLDDTKMVDRARAAADKMLRDYPDFAERHLQRWMAGREQLLKA